MKKLPLPVVIRPTLPKNQGTSKTLIDQNSGILLGSNVYWHPLNLPNLNGLALGTSGEGKTQTLLAIASSMRRCFDARIIIADLHGDLELPGETLYSIDPVSHWGINPLQLDLDPNGGGVDLQIAAVAAMLKKSLIMGPVQEGLLIDILNACYSCRGITQANYESWKLPPPTFADLEAELNKHSNDKECQKLKLKLNTLFSYGIFSKPQPPLNDKLIRLNLKALLKVPKLAPVALETLLKQLLDEHRLLGEAPGTLRTYIFIDEAGLVKSSPSLTQIAKEGRKFGIGCFLASQMSDDFPKDFLANSALKIILNVDSTERKKTALRFRIDEESLANLQAFEALIRMRHDLHKVQIAPYYQRV